MSNRATSAPVSTVFPSRPRSPLWVVVLALACEEAMHPYRMQTLMKQRGKDQVANVAQLNSVYQTIEALRRAGLIADLGTSREQRRPERTTYEATEAGRQALRAWVRTGLSTPAREFPEFPAVLSTLYGVDGPDDLRTLLEVRVEALEKRLPDLEKSYPILPRIFLLDSEYAAAVVRAEVKWLRGVMAELRSGKLAYPTEQEIRGVGVELGGPSEEALRRMTRETRGRGRSREATSARRGRQAESKVVPKGAVTAKRREVKPITAVRGRKKKKRKEL